MMNKNIRIGVFLGYKIAYNLDDWRESYKNDEANDTSPYGYDRAKDNNVEIEYIKFNKLERKLLFNKYLQYIYLYIIKLPIMLFKYDMIWTHYDKDGLYIAFLRSIPLLNKFFAKQISCFIWLIDNSRYFDIKRRMKISKLLNKIDKIIFHSPAEKDRFIEIFNCDEKRLEYIPFGINIDSYSQYKKSKCPEQLMNMKDKSIKNFILSVGTDIHRDIELFNEIAKEMKEYNFILATGNDDYLKREYPSNTIALKANLLEIRWLYNNCSCVIIPLKFNEHVSGCTTILEAAAMRKPVIVSDVPGIREYVIDGVTGTIVPLFDKESMKNAILGYINNPEYAKKIGQQAYNFIKDKFTTARWANDHVRLTKEILRLKEKN